jgi:2-succinyl-5-enolpyruvyl-6-hydroxy-3-cyclohexene-1-carboxylate synthase
VHANLAFREPLIAEPGELPKGRGNGQPWHRVATVRRMLEPGVLDSLVGVLRPSARGLIIAGAGAGRTENVRRLAAKLGWPVLADPRSGARVPGEEGAPTVAAADACLRVESFAASHVPEVVFHLGQTWASRVVGEFLDSAADAGAVQVHIDPHWCWRDPGRKADLVLPADPDLVMDAVCSREIAGGAPDRSTARAPSVWSEGWAEAEAVAQHAITRVLAGHPEVTEPGLARVLFAWLPAGSTVVASSSMPVRDLEWFAVPRSDPPRVLANRGANGIDGVTSTTLGVTAAAGGTGGHVVGLLGDLAFLHDASALFRGRREPVLPAVLVVVDNGGGGIFSFLPQAEELEEGHFERLFGTPQKVDVAELARAAGCETIEVGARDEIPGQLDEGLSRAARRGPAVVVVRTDRRANVKVHAELEAEVAIALA